MKKSQHDAMYQQIEKHGRDLLKIYPEAKEQDPVKLCKKLHRIEAAARRYATDCCNTVRSSPFPSPKPGRRLPGPTVEPLPTRTPQQQKEYTKMKTVYLNWKGPNGRETVDEITPQPGHRKQNRRWTASECLAAIYPKSARIRMIYLAVLSGVVRRMK